MSVNFPYDVQLYPAADAAVAVYSWKGSTVDLTSPGIIQKLLYGEITDDADAYGPNIVAGIEVILGVHGASGKLPVNIPAFDAESKTYTNKILFERGYGLTYDKLVPVKPDEKPKKASIKSLKVGKRKITVTMTTSPAKKGGTNYQLAYRIKGSSKWSYKTTKSSTMTIKK